jgi:DNA-3-methyladenine glycosylase II
MNSTFEQQLETAVKYLEDNDPILAPVIAKHGQPTIRPHHNYYEALVGSIISQQLSVKAAASIQRRFLALFDGTFPSPEAILQKDVEELRIAGLSRAKAAYIRDLADRIRTGQVHFEELDSLSNDEVIAELTAVKGIGEWTVHMFLMFCMGRLDILAFGDLGIRVGIRELYKLDALPTPDQVKELAVGHHWHPYETVACWYIWASKDNKPAL